MQSCDTAFGTLELDRYPPTLNPTLQPWDAADLYLLQSFADSPAAADSPSPSAAPSSSSALGPSSSDPSPSPSALSPSSSALSPSSSANAEDPPPILVINDQFGTLACALALAGHQVISWSDSFLAQRAMQLNAGHNQLALERIRFVDSQQLPPGPVARVLLRIPKSLALLEDQLSRLRPLLTDDAVVAAGAMLKHLPPSAGDLLAKYVGPYQASLAWKKARLLTARMDPALAPGVPQLVTRYGLADTGPELANLPGVFSRERLDLGTRVMLPCLTRVREAQHIVDLGCGNGALGIHAAALQSHAQLTFIDESYAAVASARGNFASAFPGREASFVVADGLLDVAKGGVDLVLCNPPFHQQQVIGDEIALRLFEQSRRALADNGELWIVGNRHLAYHAKLRRFFRHVEQMGGDNKFVVLRAR